MGGAKGKQGFRHDVLAAFCRIGGPNTEVWITRNQDL